MFSMFSAGDFEEAVEEDAKTAVQDGTVHPLTNYVINYVKFLYDYDYDALIDEYDCCYKTGTVCSAFLANTGTSNATVTFNGNSYHLPGWFVSILPDCKNVVLNTAKISEPGLLEQ
ncbi:Beta-galactosidase 8 [Trifolium repens]|nr:Beta-galactosidase 8 [Trifolium repens]